LGYQWRIAEIASKTVYGPKKRNKASTSVTDEAEGCPSGWVCPCHFRLFPPDIHSNFFGGSLKRHRPSLGRVFFRDLDYANCQFRRDIIAYRPVGNQKIGGAGKEEATSECR
jgi:hypothetical protein